MPEETEEEYCEQHHERRDRERRARDPRLEIAPDHELDQVEADEYDQGKLPRLGLSERKQGREHRRDERTDERDVIEHERDHAPGSGELEPRDRKSVV